MFLTALVASQSMVYAGMQSMDNAAMEEVDGRGGVDVSLLLRINQKSLQGQNGIGTAGYLSTDTANYDYTSGSTYASIAIDPRDSLDCDNRQFCRLAIAINNRTSAVNTETDGTTTVGNKQWLVFKGLQGYIEIPKLSLDAANVTDIIPYAGEDPAPNNRVALKLSLSAANPIKIRHLGFESLSLEVGSSAASAGNDYGYLNMKSCTVGSAACPVQGYTNGKYVSAGFDTGREVGFLGMDIHGNLAVNGSVYVFSCTARGAC